MYTFLHFLGEGGRDSFAIAIGSAHLFSMDIGSVGVFFGEGVLFIYFLSLLVSFRDVERKFEFGYWHFSFFIFLFYIISHFHFLLYGVSDDF